MKYHTVFYKGKPWENVVDDMNSGSIWAMGAIYWPEREKAEALIENLKNPAYGFEGEFTVVEFEL